MKRLALYREKSYQDRPLDKPSIEDNKFKLSESLANEIVKYLESGTVMLEFVSPIEDPYDEQDIYADVIYSDGVYVWDTTIIHWIKKYRIKLPDEFLIHYESMRNKYIGDIDFSKGIVEHLKDVEVVFCD